MAYEEGDTSPPHINVHNEVVSKLAEISAEYDLNLVLPPQRNIGDTEHVKDHNLITDALQAIDDWEAAGGGGSGELPGVGGWATVTAVQGATTSNSYTDSDGMTWKAWTWKNPRVMTAGGSIAATRDLIGSITTGEEGLIEVLIVAGGGSGFSNAGGGGAGGVIASIVDVPGGEKDVYVGSGGQNTGTGGGSAVGLLGIGGGSYRTSGDSGNGFSGKNSVTPGAGATGSPYVQDGEHLPGPGITLNWDDGVTDVVYGLGGGKSTSSQQPPDFGTGGTFQPTTDTQIYYPGANGFVLVRVPAEYAQSVTETALSDEMKARQEQESAEQAARNQQAVTEEMDES